MALENKPFYLDNNGATPAGVQQDLHLKCTLFDDGMCTWELRRICDALGFTNTDAVKYFRNFKIECLNQCLKDMDVSPNFLVVPSRRALQGMQAPPKFQSYILDEFCIDTRGMLLALVCARGLGLRAKQLDLAKGALRLCCERLLPEGFLDALPSYPQLLEVPFAKCCSPSEAAEGICFHLQKLRDEQEAMKQWATSPQVSFAILLQSFFFDEKVDCPHMGDWLNRLVDDLCCIIKENLMNACHSDPLKMTPLQKIGKKCRRLDQHLKESAAHEVKRQNLACNTQQWARATGQCNPKSLQYVRDQSLATPPFTP